MWIDGDDPSIVCSGNHDRCKADTAAPVDGDPVSGSNPTLHDDASIRGGEPATQQSSRRTVDLLGDPYEVSVGISQTHVFGEASPGAESRLELIRTHLFVSVPARFASSAPGSKRNRYAIAHRPLVDMASNFDHRSNQLVAGDVGEFDIRVVAHPSVPVAAAQPGRLNPDNHPIEFRNRLGQVDDFDRLSEL
jgi:hypothetical protein